MRVYLYEMVSGGGALLPSKVNRQDSCLAELDDFHQLPNLISDGCLMLKQLVEIYLTMPEVEVWVSIDSRLTEFGKQLQDLASVDGKSPVVLYAEPTTPWAVFEECCRGADWTQIVAPELGRLLEDAAGRCVIAGGSLLGPEYKLLQLGVDKIRLHRWAEQHDVRMPSWGILENGESEFVIADSRTLLKPVCGTGGVGVQYATEAFPETGRWLLEKYVSGTSVSVAAMVTPKGPVLLPPCYQLLGGQHGFEYESASLIEDQEHRARAWRLADQVFSALPLSESRGWVGLDLILGEHEDADVLIEMNARVTSTVEVISQLDSFVPYQWNKSTNLTELMLAAVAGN